MIYTVGVFKEKQVVFRRGLHDLTTSLIGSTISFDIYIVVMKENLICKRSLICSRLWLALIAVHGRQKRELNLCVMCKVRKKDYTSFQQGPLLIWHFDLVLVERQDKLTTWFVCVDQYWSKRPNQFIDVCKTVSNPAGCVESNFLFAAIHVEFMKNIKQHNEESLIDKVSVFLS